MQLHTVRTDKESMCKSCRVIEDLSHLPQATRGKKAAIGADVTKVVCILLLKCFWEWVYSLRLR
jgi:hypothetical protein